MKFPIGAMTVGDILDRGLKLLLARLGTFYAINVIVLSPIILIKLVLPFLAGAGGQPTLGQAGAALGGLFAVLVLAIILGPFGNAATLHVISQEFVGQRATVGDAFRFALHRFGRLLFASLLAGLLVGVGALFCLVPGILFMIWYVFVGQVVIVEGLKGERALSRSKKLTEGYVGRILGIGLLLVILLGIFGAAYGVLQKTVLPSYEQIPIEIPQVGRPPFGPAAGFPQRSFYVQKPIYPNVAINTVVEELLNILVQTYGAICMTLVYFDIRIRKEGFDLELAAQQQKPAVT
jgi:hypothetical protein